MQQPIYTHFHCRDRASLEDIRWEQFSTHTQSRGMGNSSHALFWRGGLRRPSPSASESIVVDGKRIPIPTSTQWRTCFYLYQQFRGLDCVWASVVLFSTALHFGCRIFSSQHSSQMAWGKRPSWITTSRGSLQATNYVTNTFEIASPYLLTQRIRYSRNTVLHCGLNPTCADPNPRTSNQIRTKLKHPFLNSPLKFHQGVVVQEPSIHGGLEPYHILSYLNPQFSKALLRSF